MVRVVFASDDQQIPRPSAGDVVVTSSWFLHKRLLQEGRESHLEHDILSNDDIIRIREDVSSHRTRWAEHLLGRSCDALLKFRGYRLDDFVDYNLTCPLVEILSALRICQNLDNSIGPSAVLCNPARAAQSSILQAYFGERAIGTSFLPESPSTSPTSPRPWLANPSFHAGRLIGDCLHELLFRAGLPFRRGRPVYFLNEGKFSAALAAGAAKHFPVYRHGLKKHTRPSDLAASLNPAFFEARRDLRELDERLALAWDHALETPYIVDGVNLAGGLKPVLATLLRGRTPRTNTYLSFLNIRPAVSLMTIARMIVLLEHILRKIGAGAVVVNQDSLRSGRVAALVAAKLSIPSIVIQHGVPAVYYPLKASRMFFWGEAGCTRYRAEGENPARLKVTGNPLPCDFSPNETRSSPLPFANRTFRRLALFASQPYTGLDPMEPPHAPHQHLSAFLEAAAQNPADLFVIRPHPGIDRTAFCQLAAATGHPNVVVDDSPDLAALLDRCRVVVLRNSTVGLEALLRGRRILMVNFNRGPDLVHYDDSPNCVAAHTADEFFRLIARELDREHPFVKASCDPLVRDQLALTGDLSVEMSCNEIRKIMNLDSGSASCHFSSGPRT